MVSPTSFGCAMQLSMAGTQGVMSLFPLSLKAAASAVQAAFLTCSEDVEAVCWARKLGRSHFPLSSPAILGASPFLYSIGGAH
jgi:hypothetical protein